MRLTAFNLDNPLVSELDVVAPVLNSFPSLWRHKDEKHDNQTPNSLTTATQEP